MPEAEIGLAVETAPRPLAASTPNGVVLGGSRPVDAANLFPNLQEKFRTGLSTLDQWRQQRAAEDSERDRLIKEVLYQQRKNEF